MKKVLLLNPPSRSVVIRDYFCSKVSQAAYVNPPIDFVCLSGRLSERFEVSLVDAVVERLSPSRCLERIRAINPDAIIALTGFVSWREDVRFFESLGVVPLILAGDILLENAEERLAATPCAHAFLTDFTGDDAARWLLGEREGLHGIVYREDGKIVTAPDRNSAQFSIPVPRHELFLPLDYRYPFVLGKPFASVLTEYGCPFKCGFCIMGRLGHRTRPVENVIEELKRLKELGVRDIFFMDQTFASDRERAGQLIDALENFKPRFRWLCFSRADRADPELLPRMKRAGCHTVIYGIESADDKLLKSYNKGYTSAQVRDSIAAARALGIRTVGTLLFGLPGDSVESCERTIDFAKSIKCDYISVNIAVPRMGTPMRARALSDGIIGQGLDAMDQSGTFIAMETGEFTAAALMRLKRKAIRDFYLNAPYALRRLAGVRSVSQLRIEARQGLALLGNFMKGR